MILLDKTGYYRIIYDTTGYYRMIQDTTGYYRLLQDTTGYYEIIQDTTGYYRILQNTILYYKTLQARQSCQIHQIGSSSPSGLPSVLSIGISSHRWPWQDTSLGQTEN